MFTFVLICLVVIILIVDGVLKYRFKRNLGLPGPVAYPITGNGLMFLGGTRKFLKTVKKIEKYGETTCMYMLSQPYILSINPEFIEAVLSSTELLAKADVYRYMHPWLGQGLLTSSGNKWRLHRKLLTPAFHFNILKSFLPIFLHNDEKMIKKLLPKATGLPVDIFPVIALVALDNVAEAAMGVSIAAQDNTESEYVKSVGTLSEIIYARMRHILFRHDLFFKLSPTHKTEKTALELVHNFTTNVIQKRRQTLESSSVTFENYDYVPGIKKKSAFLDLLLLTEVDGKKLPDKIIREEVDTFMFEGHDTTTSGISFALYCLSNNQEVQEKVFEEQKAIFGSDLLRPADFQDLTNMKYLELVIKEALRLYPSVPMIGRYTTVDTNICGLTIPKDTNIILDLLHLQRRPDVFEDPLSFRPERFLPDEMSKRNPYSWIAFSAGPRNCIGQKFAMLEQKVVLSSIVRNFKLLPANIEPVLLIDLILRSQNGVHVKLLPRNIEI